MASSFEKQERTFKIIVIGNQSVGKTCLAYRYCNRKFPTVKPKFTAFVDFFTKTVNIDGERITLSIWDTAGLEKNHNSLLPSYYRNLSGVVFAYDVTDIASFQNLTHWVEEARRHQKAAIPWVLVGNKCECEAQKAVTTRAARKFASDHGMTLFETSAADDTKAGEVDAIFTTIARKIKEQMKTEWSSYKEPTIQLKNDYSPKNGGCCDC